MKKLLFLLAFITSVFYNYAQVTVTGFSGGSSYSTLSAAFTQINASTSSVNAITGNITVTVTADYTETASVTIGSATLNSQLSATKTITVNGSKTGASYGYKITAFTGTTTTSDAMIKIQGADYITIQNLRLEEKSTNTTTTTQMEWGIAVVNLSTDGAQNITIKNDSIALNKANVNSVGIYALNSNATASTANIAIDGNRITNIYRAISISGHTSSYDTGLKIGSTTGNTITNYGGGAAANYGIYINFQTSPKIENNNITSATGSTNQVYGIHVAAACSTNLDINNNTITDSSSATTNQLLSAITNLAAFAGTVNINNNTILNCSYTSATNAYVYLIYENAATGTVNINYNNIYGLTYSSVSNTGNGIVYAIYKGAGAASTVNSNYNSIHDNTFNGTTGSGNIAPIFLNAGSIQNANFNEIYNNTIPVANSGTSGTIFCIKLTAPTVTASNNKIYNNSISKTSGTGVIYGIFNQSTISTQETYNNNKIYNLTHVGVGTVYGIYTYTAENSVSTISQDTIYTLSSAGGTVAAIYSQLSSPTIYKNKIYDLTSTGALGTVYGINLAVLGTNGVANIYNNIIGDLKAPSTNSIDDLVRGISLGAGGGLPNSSINLSYNTIYLNATSSGTDFSTSGIYHTYNNISTTITLIMRNNIVVNTSTPNGTGISVAFRRSFEYDVNNYSTTSNNNLFYAGTPSVNNLIYFDHLDALQTIDNFKTLVTPRETNSVSENVTWVSTTGSNANYLHINTTVPTKIESGGTPVSSPINITTDFDGDSRNSSTPDIGADEGVFTANTTDGTPPTITYTPLSNVLSTANRTTINFAAITDASGIDTTTGTKPRLYYTRNVGIGGTLQDSIFQSNNSSDKGWKYVEANNSSSPYNFTIDYNKIYDVVNNPINPGNQIKYFVVAQDLAAIPNFRASDNLVFTNTPSSVDLSTAFPISSGTLNYYEFTESYSDKIYVGPDELITTLTSIGGLFDKLNSGVVTGNITVRITGDLIEPGTVALNQCAEEGAGAGTYTIQINPDGTTIRKISSTIVDDNLAMIRFNGADRITIDGSNKYLSFINTNANPLKTGATIEFNNGSINCALQNCDIQNNSTNTSDGEITIRDVTGGVGTNSVTIANNNIHAATTGTPGGAYNGIYSLNASTTNAITITNNNIYDYLSKGINAGNITDGAIITGNSFYQTATNTTTSNYGIYLSSGKNHTISNNYIGGSSASCGSAAWTNSATTEFYGIYLTVGTASASDVQGNTIQNISLTNTTTLTTGSKFYGIYINTGLVNVGTTTANTIGHANTSGSISLSGYNSTPSPHIMIAGSSAFTGSRFENNLIANISYVGTSSATPAMYGITLNGNARKNKIYSIGTTSATPTPNIYGIAVSGSGGGELSNNFIALSGGSATNPTLYGIYDNTATGATYNVYHNSINISGSATTSTSTYGFYRGSTSTSTYVLKNNIIANQRTTGGSGFQYGIYVASVGNFESNYNDIFAAGTSSGPIGYYAAAKNTFANWTAIGSDANSISTAPNFISSTTDLHLTAVSIAIGNAALNVGTYLTSVVTTDIDGQTRRTTSPTIGADEIFTSGYWTGNTSTDWSTTSNWDDGNVPPSGTDIIVPATVTNSPVFSTSTTIGSLSIGANKTITIGATTLTINGAVSGTGTITGSASSNLIIAGTAGTLNFTSGSRTLKDFTLNANATATLGTALAITAGSSSGTLTTATGATLTTGGNLTLKSDALGTARIGNSAGTVSGNVNAECYIQTKRAWRFLTAPVTGSTNNSIFYNWQNNDQLISNYGVEIWSPIYGFADPSSSNSGILLGGLSTSIKQYVNNSWSVLSNTNTTPLFDASTNNAYCVFISAPYNSGNTNINAAAVATTLNATGSLIQGNHTKNLNAATANQYFLVANPYASPVSPQTITLSNISNNFYMWDPYCVGTYNVGQYTTYSRSAGTYTLLGSGSGSVYTNSTDIQSGQAFFVQASSTTASITFKESDKTSNYANVLRTNNNNVQVMRHTLKRNIGGTITKLDGALGVFYNGGNIAIDINDAVKFNNSTENIILRRANGSYAVEERPFITNKDTLFVRLTNTQQSSYTLELVGENLTNTPGLTAELKDKYTNTSIPLSLVDTNNYSFAVDANAASTGDRFMIVFRANNTLPVQFTNIKATQKGASVQIDWKVATELNMNKYVVEKSTDAVSFTSIATQTANNIDNSSYNAIDNNPINGSNYYRILSTDNSGKQQYSNVVKVKIDSKLDQFNIYPNPVKNGLVNLQINNIEKGNYTLKVYNNEGIEILNKFIFINSGSSTQTIKLNKETTRGNYYLQIKGGTTSVTKSFIVD